MSNNQLFRLIPKVDVVLEKERIKEVVTVYGKEPVKEAIGYELDKIRKYLSKDPSEDGLKEKLDVLEQNVINLVTEKKKSNLKHVINATGVILHTNLGRAPLPQKALDDLMVKMQGYMNLEYDLKAGKRGERYSHFEKLICEITGAEAAMAVNNNAAAALLMVSAVGNGKEVVVSRGEQIEIGGKFRIPDIIDQSGCKRIEVGTTNKTRLSDYEEVITEDCGALLKVHTSNYKVLGFTESVEREDLVQLGKKHGVPVIEDLGSGVLIDLSRYGLRKEPTVQESIKAGVDVVCFSGDKLFGGPQAGILAGKKEWIELCKKHPLTRAMRIDKCTAAMLETVFSMYEDEAYAVKNIPVLNIMTTPLETLKEKANRFAAMLKEALDERVKVDILLCENPVGGGSLPGEMLPSYAVTLQGENLQVDAFADALREGELPIVVRLWENHILFDVRTMYEKEFEATVEVIKEKWNI
ncbi:MAG: L-seryl-tRNA(Sec) selenium transferase [Lachnospiraceae bacterium]|nr:L-seryl-tRNA(Sec) selenium transferase [Lachnospiraceae bacterium]